MLFNSIDFAIFLPVVFTIYWLLKSHLSSQNLLVVCSSYIFYGWWDWRFLLLILFSTLVDYSIGVYMAVTDREKYKKILLWLSLLVNLGLLGFFKYYNFFLDNFLQSFSSFREQKFFLILITCRNNFFLKMLSLPYFLFFFLKFLWGKSKFAENVIML